MSERFEAAYSYARVCGSLTRSYLGERAAALAGNPRLGELWRELFKENPPNLPEDELADEAEKLLRFRPRSALRRAAGPAFGDSSFLKALCADTEASYVKVLLGSIAEGRSQAPDPGSLPLDFDLSAFSDPVKLFSATRWKWILQKTMDDLPSIKLEIDRRYCLRLWQSVSEESPRETEGLASLLRLEFELQNILWALRLRWRYDYAEARIQERLVDLPRIDIISPAMEAASRHLESRGEWSSWKWYHLLPENLELRSIETALRRHYRRRLYLLLHLESDSLVPLFAYYRIKQLETRAASGIIEGIKLGASPAEMGSCAAETTGGPR